MQQPSEKPDVFGDPEVEERIRRSERFRISATVRKMLVEEEDTRQVMGWNLACEYIANELEK